MPSLSSAVLRLAASSFGDELGYHDLARTRRKVEKQQASPGSYAPPGVLMRKCAVDERTVSAMPVYEVTPRNGRYDAEVLYLHGGAYIEEIGDNHWRLIRQLARRVPARVTVPVYPLAPRGRADRVVPAVAGIAREMRQRAAGPAVLMGDSAGGGMAVAVAQLLRDTAASLPDGLVLLSPWLDVTMTDPMITEVQPRDPMLAAEPLRYAGRLWAGARGTKDPMVSPLRGDMRGLPPMTVFAGTHEILLADARRLRDAAERAGVAVRLTESAGQIHAYPLWPTAEGRRACRWIREEVREMRTRAEGRVRLGDGRHATGRR